MECQRLHFLICEPDAQAQDRVSLGKDARVNAISASYSGKAITKRQECSTQLKALNVKGL
jgi:hypothetical protein